MCLSIHVARPNIVSFNDLQTIQTPVEAEVVLEPFQNGTKSLQDARQVAATVALLEAVLPFSYDQLEVRYPCTRAWRPR